MADTGNEEDRAAMLADIRGEVAMMRESLHQRYNNTDEDSYASRLEARDDLVFVRSFEQAIGEVKPDDVVDLRHVGINYGYDPDEAYSDRSVGLEYVPAIERERSQYESGIRGIQPFIDRLEVAGVTVRTAFRQVLDDEYDPRLFRSDQESLNRYLDLNRERPALMGILGDAAIMRLTLEERAERIDLDKPDVVFRANREIGFLQRFEEAILWSQPGQEIDMRVLAVNYAGNRAAAAEDTRNGLNDWHANERARTDYDGYVIMIRKYIDRLEEMGVTVRTGFREMAAKDRDPAIGFSQTALNRYLDDRAARLHINKVAASARTLPEISPKLDAASYWGNIGRSASTVAGRPLSEAVTQSQRRGRTL
jgi:hypothetical protein